MNGEFTPAEREEFNGWRSLYDSAMSDQWWFWDDEWQAGEREVDEHIANGRIETFDTMEEFLNTLND